MTKDQFLFEAKTLIFLMTYFTVGVIVAFLITPELVHEKYIIARIVAGEIFFVAISRWVLQMVIHSGVV